MLFTGAWVGLIIALIFAVIVSIIYQQFINSFYPIPHKAAILITGASSGLGEHAAYRLATLGYTVFATVRKEDDAKKLQQKTSRIIPILVDVTNQEQVSSTYETVKHRLDKEGLKLIGLINNAGIGQFSPLELTTQEQWQRQFQTNLFGVMSVTSTFLPLLRQAAQTSSQTARIILVSSGIAHLSAAGMGPYCASKHALFALAGAMRQELAKWRIQTIVVTPGAFKTGFDNSVQAHATADAADNRQTEMDIEKHGEVVVNSYTQSMNKMKDQLWKKHPHSTQHSMVADAMISGLLSKYPQTNIVAGWDVATVGMVRFIPDVLLDKVFNKQWLE